MSRRVLITRKQRNVVLLMVMVGNGSKRESTKVTVFLGGEERSCGTSPIETEFHKLVKVHPQLSTGSTWICSLSLEPPFPQVTNV